MRIFISTTIVLLLFFSLPGSAQDSSSKKIRIAIVDSYHPEYIWSQGTHEGVIKGLLESGYLDNSKQGETSWRSNAVESSRVILKKYWMDSKRKSSQLQIADSLTRITEELDTFKPDIVLLGDDNAANYIGNHFLDTDTPVVFWGVNGSPLKYGLLDSAQHPGHNITGIYQRSYHQEGIEHLMELVPGIKRIAVLSDDSPTGRAHTKNFLASLQKGLLPIKVVKVVATNSYAQWKQEAKVLSRQVDAFLISTHATLKDESGNPIESADVAKWYLNNIQIPEVCTSIVFVKEGLLSTINDSPVKQGYEAVKITHAILAEKKNPADIAAYSPEHGGFIVNQWRATNLGLQEVLNNPSINIHQIIDEHVKLD